MKKLSVLCIALCVGASATAAFARGGMGAHGMGSSHMPSHSPSWVKAAITGSTSEWARR
jgi:hypothetical protein